jgi:heme/copper-type cytochrome/quinol oxidase subunit 4
MYAWVSFYILSFYIGLYVAVLFRIIRFIIVSTKFHGYHSNELENIHYVMLIRILKKLARFLHQPETKENRVSSFQNFDLVNSNFGKTILSVTHKL